MKNAKKLPNYSRKLISSLDDSDLDYAYRLGLSVLADQYRASFYDFFCAFWPAIEPDELVLNWHIEYLCNRLQKLFENWEKKKPARDLIINIPPGTSKSRICTIIFPVWCWTRKPSTRPIGARGSGTPEWPASSRRF